jgi:hypothetical protein
MQMPGQHPRLTSALTLTALQMKLSKKLSKRLNTDDQPKPGVSLEKLKKITEDDDMTGPRVITTVSDLVTRVWNKPVKDNMRELYGNTRTPENVPVLQRVAMD